MLIYCEHYFLGSNTKHWYKTFSSRPLSGICDTCVRSRQSTKIIFVVLKKIY